MCASCGCGELHNDHGDARHLTIEAIERAAEAAGISVPQVLHNLEWSIRQQDTGFPNAIIQCIRCGENVRQADMVSHSTTCTEKGRPGHGGSTA